MISVLFFACLYIALRSTVHAQPLSELPAEEPIKWQVSTLFGLNITGREQEYVNAVNTRFITSFYRKSFAAKPVVDYFFKPRVGAGIGYNHFENNFDARSYVGNYLATGGWLSFYNPVTYIDRVGISNDGNVFSAHGSYKLISYSRQQRELFEFISRAGLSVAVIDERQELTAFLRTETAYNYYVYDVQSTSHRFTKAALNGFVNAQLLVHATRYFSFVLADLTQSFGLINPSVPETSVTVNNEKTVTLSKHKLSASGFTITTGMAIHF